jgi:parallel beta-helix repeat protein
MPPLVRTAATARSIFLFLALLVVGQRAEALIIRSDQTATVGALIVNAETSSRDYQLSATENAEPGWVIVYLQAGVIDITDEITAPGGLTVSVPPGLGGLSVQAVFLLAGALENSIKTTTISAVPVDGKGPSQDRSLTVRLLTTIVVNDARDLEDPDPLDELIDTDPAQPGEQTTLRAALNFCNARSGFDSIAFNIPGPGIPRLLPETPLPEITSPIGIDGTTQPTTDLVGIEISGEALPSANSTAGLVISAGNSTIRGLALTRFRSTEFGLIPSPAAPNPSGILLRGLGGNTVEICLLGVAPSGQIGAGNEGYGLRIESSGNTITNCLVSGNWVGGIGLFGPDATDNMISSSVGGSLGGTHSSNFLAPALTVEGLSFSPHKATPILDTLDSNLANSSIYFVQLNQSAAWESTQAGFLGGIVLHNAPRNVVTGSSIQGNGADGIRLLGDASETLLQSNVIGQVMGGSPTLKNAGHGIALECDQAHLLGNETSGNAQSGVLVRGSDNLIEGLTTSRNGECGLRCEGFRTTIGGTTFQAKGQFFSNPTGILITAPAVPVNFTPGSNRIWGNLIGAQSPFGAGQLTPNPNLRGIHIDGCDNNVIGGVTLSGLFNTIVYNQHEGILVTGGEGNILIGNTIFENGRLGIDLSNGEEGDGRDPSDPGDLDEGGNRKTNAPALLQAVQGPSAISILGSLAAGSTGSYQIEFVFLDPQLSLNASQFTILVGYNFAQGAVPLTLDLPTATDLRGSYLRLSVIDPDSNSSEHSRWVRIEGSTHSDSDGVSDEIESRVPSRSGMGTGDGNGDNLPDANQRSVASLPLLKGGYLTLAALPSQLLQRLRATSTPALQPNSQLTFPHGSWSFGFSPVIAGTSTITIFVAGAAIAPNYYNFGPTPNNPVPHWYDFSFDGSTGAQILADRVVLHFADGQRGDHDLSANGVIETEGGIANLLPALPDPRFTQLEDGSIAILWDSTFPDLFLQETPSPATTPWQFTSQAPMVAGSSSAVRVLPDHDSKLFRLVRP